MCHSERSEAKSRNPRISFASPDHSNEANKKGHKERPFIGRNYRFVIPTEAQRSGGICFSTADPSTPANRSYSTNAGADRRFLPLIR